MKNQVQGMPPHLILPEAGEGEAQILQKFSSKVKKKNWKDKFSGGPVTVTRYFESLRYSH